ncbi:putative P-loop containing nucleoside triphosphate hydrolase [Rosa chinensis]|uniref:Sulfotransferase n=1 Tax=Rosa chinensis TaxID=74649 RepID=A0A2P6SGS5_ROSCH|nr:cytosolic sulfotransferase 15 [Rosa chinensis]PRQ57873.1 putative P-loop containing nucleoside triphosphate hydrolase [Rosa chinensis]
MTENQPPDHEEKNLSSECKELLSVPKERGWITHLRQYQFQGFWCPSAEVFQAVISFQKHFHAKDSDVVVASLPKSGTTWLKALTFAILNRHRFEIQTHPLLTSNSHNLVLFFELDLYTSNLVPDFSSKFPEPRLFATHIPFPSLGTIKESNSKIIYVCRNPFDSFVSAWHFVNEVRPQSSSPLSLDEAFDMYCQGMSAFGPFWDHILGYWKESLKRPNNVLFLKYEDMKEDGVVHLKALAKFLDCPFTEEEERNGVIEAIAKLCSFEAMKKLEINKTGTFVMNWENKTLFRKAEVGDWVNYLTPKMEERMSKVIEEKLGGSGLTFKVIPELADPVQ